MSYRQLIILFIFLCCSFSIYSQVNNTELHLLKSKVINGDTVPHVNVNEITVMPPIKFKNERHFKRYSKLVRNVKKTLPYARLADHKLSVIAQTVDTIETEKQKKEYLKKAEKELFKEFEAPLKKLTFSQGKMLIKLIDRETGSNSYSLIKELKGGLSAVMWQSVARIFGSNLKSEYDNEGDDALIEYIIFQIDTGVL